MLSPEHQSARMSKIKNDGLDQYGTEPFEQQALKGLTNSNRQMCRVSETKLAVVTETTNTSCNRLFNEYNVIHFHTQIC